MHIGVDATSWHNLRGYGRYTRALLRALVRLDTANHYTLFFDTNDPSHPAPEGCTVRYVNADSPAAVAASARGRRSLGDMWRMSHALSAEPFDVLLFPTAYTYVPTLTAAKKVVVFHDVIAETFPQLTLPRRSARVFWNAKIALAHLQAHAIVTVSEYSKRCLVRHFGTRPEKVWVVGEAPDPAFKVLRDPAMTPALASCGILPDRRKVVYVGGFGPHKNLSALLEAFAGVARRDPNLQLVLVGEHRTEVFHTGYTELVSQVERLGLGPQVVFTGFLPDREVAVLLNLAHVLVLPSLMEGFGLPAVEAAACGCPVIVTRESPLRELLGDGALSIQPTAGAIEAALDKILSSEAVRSRMARAAQDASRKLTWEAAARQMLDVVANIGGPLNTALKEAPLASGQTRTPAQ